MPGIPEEFRAGMVLTAPMLMALRDELLRLGNIETVPPLGHVDEESGITFWIDLPGEYWIRLKVAAGSGGKYSWEKVKPTSGGAWDVAPGNHQGTTTVDPATEVNGNDTVDLTPNPVVWAWREPTTKKLMFQSGSC